MRPLLLLASLVVLPLATSSPHHRAKPTKPTMYRGKHHPLASFGHYYNLAQFNFTPYKVTELNVLCNRTPEIKVNYYCNLTFNWYDPNSVRQNKIVSGHCNTGWSWDGHSRHSASLDGTNPVVGYKACLLDDDTAFHVAIPNFWHPANFSLDMAHHYRDDENFTKPWDHPTTFGLADFIRPEQELQDVMYHYEPGPLDGEVVGIVD